MGQLQGKATLAPSAVANISAGTLQRTLENFRTYADGWGLDKDTFMIVSEPLQKDLQSTDVAFRARLEELFALLDTDENGFVDGLEYLSALGVLSGMDMVSKMVFTFSIFDFDRSEKMTLDELVLLLQSALSGLCKQSGVEVPSLEELDVLASKAFEQLGRDAVAGDRLSLEEFKSFCKASPSVHSWMEYHDGIESPDGVVGRPAAALLEVESAKADVCPFSPTAAELEPTSDENKRNWSWIGKLDDLKPPPPPKEDDEDGEENEEKIEADVPEDTDMPDTTPVLEHAHGFAGHVMRNGAQYVASAGKDAFVYATGNVAVCFGSAPTEEEEESGERSQGFCLSHRAQISALAVGSSGAICATGESGVERPKIVVWKPKVPRCEVLAELQGFHRCGIRCLSFSRDDKFLLSVGRDERNAVALYDWRDAEAPLRFHAVAGESLETAVLAAAWTLRGPRNFALGGSAGYLTFWSEDGRGSWRPRPALFNPEVPKDDEVLSLSPFFGVDCVVTGSVKGALAVWEGRNVGFANVDAHDGAVDALQLVESANILLSGGVDAKVFGWSADLEKIWSVDVNATSMRSYHVRSVCLSQDATKILVGTFGGEVTEIAVTTAESEDDEVGHKFGDELHGGSLVTSGVSSALATSASGTEYVCGGVDRVARVFDAADHKCKRQSLMDAEVTSLACSPSGEFLAIGLDANATIGKKGVAHIMNFAEMTPVALLNTGEDAGVSAAAFSADSLILALGLSNGVVNLYSVGVVDSSGEAEKKEEVESAGKTEEEEEEAKTVEIVSWMLRGRCDTPSGARVLQMDFSQDNMTIRVVTANGELAFFRTTTVDTADDAEGGEGDGEAPEGEAPQDAEPAAEAPVAGTLLDNMAELATVEWATKTCTVEYHVQGAWPADVKVSSVYPLKESPLCVAALDDGSINVLHYPCATAEHRPAAVLGHAGGVAVAKVQEVEDVLKLVSVGDTDGAVLQWGFEVDEGVDSAPEDNLDEDAEEEEPEEEEEEGEEQTEVEVVYEGEEMDDFSEFDVGSPSKLANADAGLGKSLGDVQKAQMTSPDPDVDLHLTWVHGYNGRTCRDNVFYDSSGRVVFNAAALCVLLDKQQWSQTFMMAHVGQISSLAQHPNDSDIFASGDIGVEPTVYIWRASGDAEIMSRLQLWRGLRGVSAMAFSPDGEYLAIAAADAENTVQVWRWRDAILCASCASGLKRVLTLAWSNDATRILSGGESHFRLWRFHGRLLTSKKGLFGAAAKKQHVHCATFVGENFVMGMADGALYQVGLETRKVENVVEAHSKGAVGALATFRDLESNDTHIVSGGDDGILKFWNASLEPIDERADVLLKRSVPSSFRPQVRSLRVSSDSRKLCVGTRGGEIFECFVSTGADVNMGPLVRAHCRGPLRCVAPHPQKQQFASCGADKTLRVWRLASTADSALAVPHSQVGRLCLQEELSCCTFTPDGHLLITGDVKGAVTVVSLLDLETTHDVQPLHVVRQPGAAAAVTDMEMSPNGEILAAAAADGVVYFFDALQDFSECGSVKVSSESLRVMDFGVDNAGALLLRVVDDGDSLFVCDVKEKTTLSNAEVDAEWTSAKCFAVGDVSAAAHSATKNWVAVGGLDGSVRLGRHRDARKKSHFAGGSSVSSVCFTLEDDFVVSADQVSRALLVWRVAKSDANLAVTSTPDAPKFLRRPRSVLKVTDAPVKADLVTDAEIRTVYGASDVTGGVAYVANGKVLFAAGAVSVRTDGDPATLTTKSNTTEPMRCITAMAVTSDGLVCASATAVAQDEEGTARVQLWDTVSTETYHLLEIPFAREVAALSFSPGNLRLCAVGAQGEIAVFTSYRRNEWMTGPHMRPACSTPELHSSVAWVSESQFLTVAHNDASTPMLRSFQIRHVADMTSQVANWGEVPPGVVSCAASKQGEAITGTTDGRIVSWRAKAERQVLAHSSAVAALWANPENLVSVSASDAGEVCVWNADFAELLRVNISQNAVGISASVVNSSVAALALLGDDGSVAQMDVATGTVVPLTTAAHNGEAITALMDAKRNCIASVGLDGYLRLWRHSENGILNMLAECDIGVLSDARAPGELPPLPLWVKGLGFAISSSGECVALATPESRILVLSIVITEEEATLEATARLTTPTSGVKVLAFDEKGESLVAGLDDGTVQLYTGDGFAFASATARQIESEDGATPDSSPICSMSFESSSRLLCRNAAGVCFAVSVEGTALSFGGDVDGGSDEAAESSTDFLVGGKASAELAVEGVSFAGSDSGVLLAWQSHGSGK